MELLEILGYFSALIIGISLGLIGGGGIKDMYASAKSNTLAIASEVKSTADSFRL